MRHHRSESAISRRGPRDCAVQSSPFPDGEREAQREEATCLKSYGQKQRWDRRAGHLKTNLSIFCFPARQRPPTCPWTPNSLRTVMYWQVLNDHLSRGRNQTHSICSICQFPWCKYSHCGHFELPRQCHWKWGGVRRAVVHHEETLSPHRDNRYQQRPGHRQSKV